MVTTTEQQQRDTTRASAYSRSSRKDDDENRIELSRVEREGEGKRLKESGLLRKGEGGEEPGRE